MKKISMKVRMQWGFFVAALFGVFIAILFVPTDRSQLDIYAPKVKIIINGDVVAITTSMERAKAGYNAARQAYNKDGIEIMDAAVFFEYADKEKDKEILKDHKILKDDVLESEISSYLKGLKKKDSQLAYVVRVDDCTVRMDKLEDVVSVLEQAQGVYDTTDAFQVNIMPQANENISTYEVTVSQKENAVLPTDVDSKMADENEEISENDEVDESANIETEETSNEESENTEASETDANDNEQLVAQAQNDGVKNIGFSDKIQVMATYTAKSNVLAKADAYDTLAKEKGEEAIYVVEPGDYMELIAQKNQMSVDELKELNPQITSDEDLYYDDRLNVMVPEAPVSIVVEKQKTYEENYYADVVYEDDDSMFIGESSIVQEGIEGKHIVTDMITYEGEVETNREQIDETIEVEPVAQIIRRGTKSRPTYMYPVTNWNVTSTFGYRWGRLHAGTDVGIPIGTTVRASRSGQVVTAGWVGGYGNCVMIDHGDGVQTRYGHLSQVLVSVGQYVDQGQQIALSGNTGRSTGPHLHFEVRVNGEATDATPYLEGRQ